MKKYLFLFIIVSFLAGCGSGGGGSAPAGGDSNTGNNTGNTGGNKVNPQCSRTGKIAKLKVSKDGIYKVAYSDLYSDCPAVSIASATISLSNQGADIPIEVIDSNGNGFFEAGDSIEFYGKAIGRDDSRFRFTETNVYWLSVGEKTGTSMVTVNPLTGQPPSPPNSSFPRRLHIEKDTHYVQENYPEIKSPPDVREHWFWGDRIFPFNPQSGDVLPLYQFSTRHIDKNLSVSIKVRLQSVSFDHYIKIYVNNNLVWNNTWDSQDPYDLDISGIPGSYFNNGPNNLTIESVGGGLFYLDWFEVIYNRQYKAEFNVIEFTGKNLIKLSGFSSLNVPDISVYEISDPGSVKKINLLNEPEKTSSGDYQISFSSPYNNDGLFIALTSDEKGVPVIESYTPSDIKSKEADYIIIAHDDFADAIKTLADYRAQQGYKTLTVKVGDIYDEFGNGIEDPHAIREFLDFAYHSWHARYVLLVGDATIDYKDLLGNGSVYGVKNYIPSYPYNYPGLGEVPSDNWYADVDDTNGLLPEMAIGRIPAKTKADVAAVVNKIISHESSSVNSNILLVADTAKQDNGLPAPAGEQIFETLSDSIAGLAPAGYVPYELYRRTYEGDLKAGLISAINGGQLIVNYSGHGSVTDWTNDDIFSSEDVASLGNNNEYPFVVALNCMNGYFILPDEGVVAGGVMQNPSISESFLLGDGKGALAVWSASAIGYPSEHDPLARALYNLIFNENVMVLGDAVTEAKKRAYANNDIPDDVVQTFIFFGDPATRLK